MLRDRIITSAVLVAVLLVSMALDLFVPLMNVSGLWLVPLLAFFTYGTSIELAHLLRGSGRLVYPSLAVAGAMVTSLSAAVPLLWPLFGMEYPTDCPVGRLGWIGIGALFGISASLAYEMITYGRSSRGGIERISSAALATTYVGVPLALLAAIRNLGPEPNWGIAALLSLLTVTKAADVGAFFVGRAVGRNRMVPLISPGKTWEGAVGGVIFSVITSYFCIELIFPLLCYSKVTHPWWGSILLGTLCAIAGMFGDLAESYMKRDSGVKDSGGLLPGMGGVWDVTDSLIGAAVPGFLCFAIGAAGPVT